MIFSLNVSGLEMSGLGIPLEGVELGVTVADALGEVVEALDAGTGGDVGGNGVKKLAEAFLEESRGEEVFCFFADGGAGDSDFMFEADDDVFRNLPDGHGVIGRAGCAEDVVAEVEECAVDLFPEALLVRQGTA